MAVGLSVRFHIRELLKTHLFRSPFLLQLLTWASWSAWSTGSAWSSGSAWAAVTAGATGWSVVVWAVSGWMSSWAAWSS